jgi:hypothetical protein
VRLIDLSCSAGEYRPRLGRVCLLVRSFVDRGGRRYLRLGGQGALNPTLIYEGYTGGLGIRASCCSTVREYRQW